MIGNPGFSNAYSELCFLHLCPVDIFELLEKKIGTFTQEFMLK